MPTLPDADRSSQFQRSTEPIWAKSELPGRFRFSPRAGPVRAAVLHDVDIAYSPTWLFQDLIDTGEVLVLMPTWQPSPLPLHLVSPPERRHAAKVRAFSEHLASALVDCSMCN